MSSYYRTFRDPCIMVDWLRAQGLEHDAYGKGWRNSCGSMLAYIEQCNASGVLRVRMFYDVDEVRAIN